MECGVSEACLGRGKLPHAQEKFEEFAPPVLFLQLGRGQRDLATGAEWKVRARVDVPFTQEWAERTYDLCGVVQHKGGSLHGGHYVSAVRGERGDVWLHCDDNKVRVVSGDFVSAMEAYLLVYIRREVPEVPLLREPRAFRRPRADAGYVNTFAECWHGLGNAMVWRPEPHPIAAAGPIDVADDEGGEVDV